MDMAKDEFEEEEGAKVDDEDRDVERALMVL